MRFPSKENQSLQHQDEKFVKVSSTRSSSSFRTYSALHVIETQKFVGEFGIGRIMIISKSILC